MSAYQHQLVDDVICQGHLQKIVCVGRNYAAHAKELNNPVESSPLLFIKPATAAVPMAGRFSIPKDRGAVHHELELAVLIGAPLTSADDSAVESAIAGIGLAYDLTLRDLQGELKQKSHPWERAKAFDGACPLSAFISAKGLDLQSLHLTLQRNGELQQSGATADMLFPALDLIATMSQSFTLLPGDVVLTGTPAGVGPLLAGDELVARLLDAQKRELLTVQSTVI